MLSTNAQLLVTRVEWQELVQDTWALGVEPGNTAASIA